MQLTIRLNESDVKVGLDTISLHLVFPSSETTRDYIHKLIGKDVNIEIKQYREKRSLNANALFYLMVDKLANVLRTSKPYIHNLMLRKYGQLQKIDGRPVWVVLPENDEVSQKVDEDDSLHLKPTSELKEGKDGRMYRTYLLLKGSHELDKKDMGILLDGVLDEAKQVGIDTLNPKEVQRIKERWGIDIEKYNH